MSVISPSHVCLITLGNGKFITSFGTKGDRPGQFEKPYSVAVNSQAGGSALLLASTAEQQWSTVTDSATAGPLLTPTIDLASDPLLMTTRSSSIDVELQLDSFFAGEHSSPSLDDTLDLVFLELVLMRTDEDHLNSLIDLDLSTMLTMDDHDTATAAAAAAAAAAQDDLASSFFLESSLLYHNSLV